MELKSVTWNIGGGKAIKSGEDPMLMASYTEDGIEDIAKWLKQNEPDIIALQEVHGDDHSNQIEYIAKYLGYNYYFYDPIATSHIDSTQMLGNGIISKYPVAHPRAGIFLNPNISFDLEGKHAVTNDHDTGYVSCEITIQDTVLSTTCLHLIPFRKVGLPLDSEKARDILASVASELPPDSASNYQLILGDFNIDASTVGGYLHELMTANSLSEIEISSPTGPDGQIYDHVLYSGLELNSIDIDTSLKTDHYPVMCTFELL